MNARIPAAAVAAGSIALLVFLASQAAPSGLPLRSAGSAPSLADDASDHRRLRLRPAGARSDPRTVQARAPATAAAAEFDAIGQGQGLGPENYVTADAQRTFEDELCVASVDDGTVAAASVVGGDGDLGGLLLALPEGYDGAEYALVECTGYARLGPSELERSRTLGIRAETRPLASQGGRGGASAGDHPQQCDPMGYRPGHYDAGAGVWRDRCTGRATSLAEPVDGSRPRTGPPEGGCPILDGRRGGDGGDDVWVHFVGDSVMRGWFVRAFLRDDMRLGRETEKGGDHRDTDHPDYVQAALLMGDDDGGADDAGSGAPPRIWATYVWDEIKNERREGAERAQTSEYFFDTPRTWGDFLAKRKLNREGDGVVEPSFPDGRVPDVIFYGPGYHASTMGSGEYGTVVDNVLALWEGEYRDLLLAPGKTTMAAAMPRMHLLLNIMPAPWLIPDKYAFDREHRTLLNEHRKNRAIIEAARKNREGGGFVRGVVDAFSPELPLNGREGGASAHGDAVHIYEDYAFPVFSVVGDLLMEAICSSN